MKKSIPLALCAVLPVLAHASQFATGGVEAVVPGTADVTHTFTESGTFTLSQAATVRLLVVGGGGGGGCDCAGGGGGGGAGANSTSLSSAAGGSGLVVVRMRTGQDGIVILVR